MRKECSRCQYGTSKRGKAGDKNMSRHFTTTGHNKTPKEWSGYKGSVKIKK